MKTSETIKTAPIRCEDCRGEGRIEYINFGECEYDTEETVRQVCPLCAGTGRQALEGNGENP